jgi:FKBP-type peptidyl-prolyl cis-trans isomerase FklB
MKSFSLSISSGLLLFLTGCKSGPSLETPPPAVEASTAAASASTTASPSTATASAPAALTPDSNGFYTTASGLQYRILASGPADGRSPSGFDQVTVHYRGTLIDGTVFDSSVERGVPATFSLSQVIPGWREALKLMKPGDQWALYIPASLAYGNRAVGDKISPNSDLIFHVALIQIVTGG